MTVPAKKTRALKDSLHEFNDDIMRLVSRSIREVLESLCDDKFEVSGEPILLPTVPVKKLGTASFGGDKVHGNMSILATPEFLTRLDPLQRASLTDPEHAEWLSEFTNRVVGSFKSLCCAYRVDFQIGLPQVIMGNNLELVDAKDFPIATFYCTGKEAEFQLIFQAEFASSVNFSGEPDLTLLIGGVGDTSLF